MSCFQESRSVELNKRHARQNLHFRTDYRSANCYRKSGNPADLVIIIRNMTITDKVIGANTENSTFTFIGQYKIIQFPALAVDDSISGFCIPI